ncbi:hypothetical protein [Actinomadura oligospora]|uniref:hypothetical protein n=1 Tax=Actinomadura oligospora TaxID=111804 RepID=UPI00047D8A2C|nr:hypothetical protein [Actinomadura oligospora]
MDSDTISLADPAERPLAPAGSSTAAPGGVSVPGGVSFSDGRTPSRGVPEPGDTLVHSPHRPSSPEALSPGSAPSTPAWTTPIGPGPTATPEDLESAPVFVDLSGRRRRIGRRAGIACGGLLAAFLLAMGIGVATGASVPGTPWNAVTGTQHHKKSKPPVLQPKSIPHGQNRPAVTGPVTVPSGANGRQTDGRGPAPSGSSAPSSTPKPSSSAAPTTSATPLPTRSRPGRGQVTPPGQTKRPKATG